MSTTHASIGPMAETKSSPKSSHYLLQPSRFHPATTKLACSPAASSRGGNKSQSSNSFLLESPPMHRPPISFVLVKDRSSEDYMARSSVAKAGVSSSRPVTQSLGPHDATGLKSVSNFRLQPRHPVKSISSVPGSRPCSDSTRGRKRTAHSISDIAFCNAQNGVCSTENEDENRLETVVDGSTFPEKNTSVVASPSLSRSPLADLSPKPMSPGRFDDAVLYFQGLSIMSPRPFHSPSVDAASPSSLKGDQLALGRSSFSKYGASPSAGSVPRSSSSISSESFRPPPRPSPTLGSTRSSPRLAPVTVLTSDKEGADAMSKNPTSNKAKTAQRRPPLYGGAPSHGRSLEDPTSGNTKTIQGVEDRLPLTPVVAALKGAVSADMTASTSQETPTKKSRVGPFDSPGQFSRMSPRTPLPRITLTPRSTDRSRSSDGALPRMPSPTDSGFFLPSPALSVGEGFVVSSTPCANADSLSSSWLRDNGTRSEPRPRDNASLSARSVAFPPRARDEFLPRLGSNRTYGFNAFDTSFHREASRGEPESMGPTMPLSFLEPPTSRGTRDVMIGQAMGLPVDAYAGSLSDSDDEDAFLLAIPSAIEEERKAKRQPVKLRRLSADCSQRRLSASSFADCSQRRLSASSCGFSNLHQSTNSLQGVDFVSSNQNLVALERKCRRRLDSNSSPTSLHHSSCGSSPRLKRGDSLASIGMPLEFPHQQNKGSGIEDGAGRDLVTPPAMGQASSPPPLSPHSRCL